MNVDVAAMLALVREEFSAVVLHDSGSRIAVATEVDGEVALAVITAMGVRPLHAFRDSVNK